jgi:hypothetical protein
MGGGDRGNRYSYARSSGNSVTLDKFTENEEEKQRDEAKKAKYEGEVNDDLQDNLSDYNNRDQDKINTHIQTIKDAINNDDIIPCALTFGGSIKKHTYVDGLSDVDMLAIINDPTLADKSPSEARQYIADKLRQRLRTTNVTTGPRAVTVEFSDGTQIQVLPAQKTSTGVRISSEDGKSWSNVIHPEKFTNKLTDVNKKNGGSVVPVIKLYKAINSKLPEESQLSGYHIEAIAINAFRDYDGPTDRKAMLTHLVEYASKAVLTPIRDKTGQSIHIDDSLGSSDSYERQRASAAIQGVEEKIRQADEEKSRERWSELF